MDKNAIKKYAVWARTELIDRVSQKALQYGITEKDSIPADATSVNGVVLSNAEIKQRKALIEQINKKGYKQVLEEVAYTWFNRFSALRFMEVNGYLPSRVRVFTNENNQFEPQIITEAIDLEMDGLDMEKVYAYKDANDNEGLFKYLIIVQCNTLSPIMPRMFQRIADYTELLLPDNLLREGSVIEQMISTIPEEDWQDAVQIIGWLYQYYISEKHDEIVNINKGTVKQEDVPAATQLFTTDWVVRYMVDNSLGRYWIERHPESSLAEKLEFLVKPKDGKIQTVNEAATPQDLTFFDPCMGSGHILAYAFDVLMEIYREYGYTDREAVAEIIQNNLYGFDIDERCTQLAYFVVMMKARQYDARFFKRELHPQVYYPKADSDLKAYGSLLQIDTLDAKPEEPEEFTLFDMDYDIKLNDWNCRRLLSQKYAVVCTNPPYLNKYNDKLKKFVTENYKDYSGDLFSVFIYRNFGFCKKDAYSAFMTPFLWMFIKTYESLRTFVIENKSITSLVQMEYSAFEEATVPICSFILNNQKRNEKSLCIKLSEFRGGMEIQKTKVLEAIDDSSCSYFYETEATNFSKIPGSPLAFWGSMAQIDVFTRSTILTSIANPKQGLITGDVNRFVRKWYECSTLNLNFEGKKEDENRLGKWFPYCNGGGYRKWYGNNEDVVNWYLDGIEVKGFTDEKGKQRSRPQNQQFYFQEGGTWSAISSSSFSVRYFPEGFLFSNAGMAIYTEAKKLRYIIGFLNSKLCQAYLGLFNEGLNYNQGDIAKLPIMMDNVDTVVTKTEEIIALSRADWDSFETSWDFQIHPLVRLKDNMKFIATDGDSDTISYFLQGAYRTWENECDKRFAQLKANEEELNRIFIDIYGLQDELTPEVEDKDVTVRKADLQRDIKSLISYAVGCMFGRYSLDVDGLAYAGGEWDASKYTTYPADKDNIIPICDDEYFDDDIVGCFVKFIEAVYGKDTLEENLKFIADALGGKGQPREVIRDYFLNDFYADHCKIYQKRPIYWLFDSGKKNGFKALIYMHRYQPDTIARIRTDYVHEQQSRYRTAIADMEQRLLSASTGERVKLTKALARLTDQEAELRSYEEKIHHLADQMIAIDLDDGVKVNYAKFQDVLAKIK